jgi:hypothetical protein
VKRKNNIVKQIKELPKVPATEILRVEVGSTLYGINIGSGDLDLMSIAIEPRAAITGLKQWDHWSWRTANKDERSEPDDIDWTVYGLQKYLRLAIKGNPSTLALLYAPENFREILHPSAGELLMHREAIVSQDCIPRFLGYLNGQRQRALKGKGTSHGNRDGRREKWTSHMVRLGYQCLDMVNLGEMRLPMPEEQAETCKSIKCSEISINEALKLSEELENRIKAVKDPALPEKPDIEFIENWLHYTYINEYTK